MSSGFNLQAWGDSVPGKRVRNPWLPRYPKNVEKLYNERKYLSEEPLKAVDVEEVEEAQPEQ